MAIKMKNNSLAYFKMVDLFVFKKGKRLTALDMLQGEIPFISATKFNNGVRQFIANGVINQPNCISVNYNGSVGEAFYQDVPFIASDDVNLLYAKKDWQLNKQIAIYLCTVIKHNRSRFDFGRKWKLERMKESELYLPQKNGSPDWDYMENYIKSIEQKVIFKNINTQNSRKNQSINFSNWKEYNLSSLFDIYGVGSVKVEDLITKYGYGDYPYITRTEQNNGVSGFYDFKMAPSNVLTIETSLSGLCFYHEYEFSTGDHIAILKPKNFEINKYIALFIKSVWRKNAYKYDYGRPAIIKNIEKTIIPLPTTPVGTPDWNYMEHYIKNLPYGDNI